MAETTGWRRPELRPRQQQGGEAPSSSSSSSRRPPLLPPSPALSCCLPGLLPPTTSTVLSSITATMRICDSEENRRKLAWLVPGYILLAWFFCVVFQVFSTASIHSSPSPHPAIHHQNIQPTIPSLSASPLCLAMATTTTTTTSPCTRSSTCKTILRSEYERSCRSDRRTTRFSCSAFGLRLLTYKTDCAINYTFITLN